MASRLRKFNIKQLVNVLNHSKGKQKCALSLQKYSSRSYASKPSPVVFQKLGEIYQKYPYRSIIGSLGIAYGLYIYTKGKMARKSQSSVPLTEKIDYTKYDNIAQISPSREVLGPRTDLGLELTIYQYQSCPFCCKVRAFLEYHGIPYKVVEVHPVMRQQLKFSKYKKVPILIVGKENSSLKYQLNDSSAIISILSSFLVNPSGGLEPILPYYVPLVHKNEKGKEVEEVMNKYHVMYGESGKGGIDEDLKNECKWRKWADDEYVHILSPNIYRTLDEATQSFNNFSVRADYEKLFSTYGRILAIHLGATFMYFIGKNLKKKYALKDDVRQSLYDACNLWVKEIGPKRKFMGGNTPNLADLAVYGMLNSIEGCLAFQDVLDNTNIEPWYESMKEAVTNHHGYQAAINHQDEAVTNHHGSQAAINHQDEAVKA